MFRYGFELEGFFTDGTREGIVPPPKDANRSFLDGFPGLCEVRTSGGKSLTDAAAELVGAELKLANDGINWFKHEHKFNGEEMSYLRKNFSFEKEQLDVQNIYGKKPRALNGRTLASFQINISNLLSEERFEEIKVGDSTRKVYHAATYGLLDVAGIVRRLDEAFAEEIKLSNRQPGMYAIKDNHRLEYRSLPNSTWNWNPIIIRMILNKIKKAVEGE